MGLDGKTGIRDYNSESDKEFRDMIKKKRRDKILSMLRELSYFPENSEEFRKTVKSIENKAEGEIVEDFPIEIPNSKSLIVC